MSKCNRCNIEILDHALTCPLCNGVLEQDMETTESKSLMYPDVTPKMKKMLLVIKIVIFSCIIAEPILLLINHITTPNMKWSLITGVAMIYICFTIVHFFRKNTGLRSKMMIQTICIMILSVLIDYFLGYTGWSIDIAVPCAILALNVVILIFMILDRNNWQSYILLQVFSMILSILLSLLIFTDCFRHPFLMIITDAVTLIFMGATIVFGDRRATTELKRRFHV